MEINPEQTTQQPTSFSLKTLWLGFTIVVILLVGAGSYVLGARNIGNIQVNQQVAQTPTSIQPPSPTQAMTKDDIRRMLIDRCGDIPREKLNLPTGHFTVVDGPSWSPDCRHIAWSVWNSGTGVINSDGSVEPISSAAGEGVFLYTEATGKITKLSIPNPYNNNPILQQWRDRDTLIIDYNTNVIDDNKKTNKGRANFTFDITTNTAQPQ